MAKIEAWSVSNVSVLWLFNLKADLVFGYI